MANESIATAPEVGLNRAAVVCSHCGLPVPKGLVRADAETQFCCAGCETVYEVVRANGLERYYTMLEVDADTVPARTTGRGYEELDAEEFRERYTWSVGGATAGDRSSGDGSASGGSANDGSASGGSANDGSASGGPASGGLQMTELLLEGVHCAACVWLVEKLPEVVPGVLEARLDLRRALVKIVWDDELVPLSRVARTLDSLGYPAHPARDADARRVRAREDRRMLIRLGVAGAAAGNVMALSFALYGGAFSGMETRFSMLFRMASMLIAAVTVFWPGRVFFQGALAAVRTRTPHLDLPIALGISVGLAAGVLHTITGTGEVYFDSITVLIFLLLVGRFIQHRQQRRTADALDLLFSLTPGTARRIEAGGTVTVPIEALGIEDRVEVCAGDTVPVDGVIEEGRSSLDRSLLTGESDPEAVGPGQPVRAGSVNLSARLIVRVEATGDQTRVGKLMRFVEEHMRRKAPIVCLADRIAGWFVSCLIALALATFIVGSLVGMDDPFGRITALLIVSCPCALGLATPLVLAVAIARAAAAGVFVKGGDALERVARGTVLYLDKTGTVTEGRVALVHWEGSFEARRLVAALEAESRHPIARGLCAGLSAESDGSSPLEDSPGGRLLEVSSVEQILGCGIRGDVGGRAVVVGKPAFVLAHAGDAGGRYTAIAEGYTAEALTPVLVAIDDEVVAAAGLGDPIRPDAAAAIAALRNAGFEIGMLSGDHPAVVRSVARRLGIEPERVHGGVTPEEKLAVIEEEAAGTGVVMVGDGVNDAAALAAATAGVAVHGGAEASLAAADVALTRPGLLPVVHLVTGGRRALAVIRRCLVVSLVYNTGAAVLAVAGMIHPWVAAILMPASSLTVLAMALASKTFTGDRS